MVGHMVKIGEETGELEKMLGKIADFYEDEVDASIQSLTSIIEPIMMIGVGIMVGIVIITHVPADVQAADADQVAAALGGRLRLGRVYRDAPPGDLFLVLHRHRRDAFPSTGCPHLAQTVISVIGDRGRRRRLRLPGLGSRLPASTPAGSQLVPNRGSSPDGHRLSHSCVGLRVSPRVSANTIRVLPRPTARKTTTTEPSTSASDTWRTTFESTWRASRQTMPFAFLGSATATSAPRSVATVATWPFGSFPTGGAVASAAVAATATVAAVMSTSTILNTETPLRR